MTETKKKTTKSSSPRKRKLSWPDGREEATWVKQVELQLPPGDVIKGLVTANELLVVYKAIHRGGPKTKGYVIVHRPTWKVVCWAKLQRDALWCQRELEALDWGNFEQVEKLAHELQRQFME